MESNNNPQIPSIEETIQQLVDAAQKSYQKAKEVFDKLTPEQKKSLSYAAYFGAGFLISLAVNRPKKGAIESFASVLGGLVNNRAA